MSLDFVISLLISSILFFIFFVIAFFLAIFFILWASERISSPSSVALKDLNLDEDERDLLRRKYLGYRTAERGRFTYIKPEEIDENDDRVKLTNSEDWEFVAPKDSIRLADTIKDVVNDNEIKEKLKASQERHAKFKERFEIEHQGLLEEIDLVTNRQKPARFFMNLLSILVGLLLLGMATSAFLFSISFFGVDIGFKTKREVDREIGIREQQIANDLNLIENSAAKLSNSKGLTIEAISNEAVKLNSAVSNLQVNLNEQILESNKKRENLDVRTVEFDAKVKQFENVQNIRQEEFDSVKALLFEETIKSSRQYWLLGLISSIPLFWLSDLIKFWFLRLLSWMRMHPNSENLKILSSKVKK